jgi:hypothetical protein
MKLVVFVQGYRKDQSILISLLLTAMIGMMIMSGCATLPDGHKWGQDVTFSPEWDTVKESAVNATKDPETWVPVAGALVLQIDNMDQRISDWASEKHPLFGSGKNAGHISDYLEAGSGLVYLTTVLATPSGDDASDWLTNKARGLSIGIASGGITSGLTTSIKAQIGRPRPSGSADSSFPSGHESCVGVFTTLARRNLNHISMSWQNRLFANIGIAGIASGTAWGRVEAKAHYPSDVLVGYALGHFISSVINDSFLGLKNKKAPLFTFEPSRKGVFAGLRWTF